MPWACAPNLPLGREDGLPVEFVLGRPCAHSGFLVCELLGVVGYKAYALTMEDGKGPPLKKGASGCPEVFGLVVGTTSVAKVEVPCLRVAVLAPSSWAGAARTEEMATMAPVAAGMRRILMVVCPV